RERTLSSLLRLVGAILCLSLVGPYCSQQRLLEGRCPLRSHRILPRILVFATTLPVHRAFCQQGISYVPSPFQPFSVACLSCDLSLAVANQPTHQGRMNNTLSLPALTGSVVSLRKDFLGIDPA